MEGVAKRLGGGGENIEEKQEKLGRILGFYDAVLPGRGEPALILYSE